MQEGSWNWRSKIEGHLYLVLGVEEITCRVQAKKRALVPSPGKYQNIKVRKKEEGFAKKPKKTDFERGKASRMSEKQREKGYKEAGQLFGVLLRGQARGTQRSTRSDTSGAVAGRPRVWPGTKPDWSRLRVTTSPRVTTSSRSKPSSSRIKGLNRRGRLRKHLYNSRLGKNFLMTLKCKP